MSCVDGRSPKDGPNAVPRTIRAWIDCGPISDRDEDPFRWGLRVVSRHSPRASRLLGSLPLLAKEKLHLF